MAVYLDPPLWPAHGTHFSHLISDTSLEELHAFAAAAGIPERAFDGDHYDVAEARYDALVTAGAVPVEGRVLVRKLIASGLRIPARQRSGSLKLPLLTRWNEVLPGHDALFLDLLDRWGEEHRRYHGRTHLLAVLEALDLLAEPARPPRAVVLSAWFHDAVYRGIAGQDEEESARLAEDRLRQAGLPAVEVDEVARLVRLTADHRPEPGDDAGALLSDADLSVLGAEPAAYARYLAAVRQDFAHIGDQDFAAGRAAVVRGLLQLDPLFSTSRARELWLEAAHRNLRGELARAGDRPSHPRAEVLGQAVE
jgi:predicted metal-dependent HD superfamily phosphohydrolase